MADERKRCPECKEDIRVKDGRFVVHAKARPGAPASRCSGSDRSA